MTVPGQPLGLLAAAGAAGQAALPDAFPAVPSAGPGYTLTLFIVVCAAAGAWLWWRGRRQPAGPWARGERRLAIAETRSLGSRQYLVVASYDDRKFLLGVCPGRIDLLSRLEEGDGKPPLP